MTPRYAAAAQLMIARMASRSSSPHRLILTGSDSAMASGLAMASDSVMGSAARGAAHRAAVRRERRSDRALSADKHSELAVHQHRLGRPWSDRSPPGRLAAHSGHRAARP